MTSLETELAHNFFITHHTVTVSNRTYIRQLVQDLAKQIGIVATTWSISRIQNGPFKKKDCLEINELEDLKIILAF